MNHSQIILDFWRPGWNNELVPETPISSEKKPEQNEISRRLFLKILSALTGITVAELASKNQPILRTMIDRLVVKQVENFSDSDVETFLIDYSPDTSLTDAAIDEYAKKMAGQIVALIEKLKGLPEITVYPDKPDEVAETLAKLQEATRQMHPSEHDVEQLLQLTRPLVRAVVDVMIAVVGQHGQFVESTLQKEYKQIHGDQRSQIPDQIKILPLQGLLSDFTLDLSPSGTISAHFRFDAGLINSVLDQAYALHPEERKTTIVPMSFQFGEASASMKLLQIPDISREEDLGYVTESPDGTELIMNFYYPADFDAFFAEFHRIDVDQTNNGRQLREYDRAPHADTSQIHFVWIYVDDAGAVTQIEKDFSIMQVAFPKSLSTKKELEVCTAYLQKQIDTAISAHKNVDEQTALISDLVQLKALQYVTNYKTTISDVEPYAAQTVVKNFEGYRQFCARQKHIFSIHAGGNNSDLRAIHDFPENGIVVSAVSDVGKEVFHRDGYIGALGAEIYLLDEDFDAKEKNFSTSEAVGIVSAFAEVFAGKGFVPIEIKKILTLLCCENERIVHNSNVSIENGLIFKPEKAQAVASLAHDAIKTWMDGLTAV